MRNHAIAGLVALAAISGSAHAADVFDSWKTEKADGRCTAYTMPASSNGAARDGAYLAIVNVPGEGVKNSVSMVYRSEGGAGKAHATATIGGETFELLTFDKAAFAASGAPEAALIAAMRKGGEISVNWTDADGSIAKDTYALKGFNGAKSKIDGDCR